MLQVYAGAILNVAGGVLRVISTIEPVICSTVGHSGYTVAMIGQILTACAQPFLLYSPTTLASVWFGPNERAIATGLSSLGKLVSSPSPSPDLRLAGHSHWTELSSTESETLSASP